MEFNSHHFAPVQKADPVATCRKLLEGSEADELVRVVYRTVNDVFRQSRFRPEVTSTELKQLKKIKREYKRRCKQGKTHVAKKNYNSTYLAGC